MKQIKDITSLIGKLNLNRELNRNKIILIVIASLFLAYLDFSLLIQLQSRGISALRPKIVKLNKDIADFTKELSAVKEFEQNKSLPANQKELARAKKIIKEDELPLLLEDITDMANKGNIKIMQIRPGKDPKAKEETISGVKLIPVTITLNFSCGYHSLGNFISAIENSNKFMLAQEIKILAGKESYLAQEVALTIKSYVKK
jgi:hypothetical protein